MDELLKKVYKALSDLKLEDIIIYDFRTYSPHYDYQIISSASSERQANAAINHIRQAVPELNSADIEGRESSRWILIDLKSIIVHVMHKEDREFYQLENLFFEREKISLEEHNGL